MGPILPPGDFPARLKSRPIRAFLDKLGLSAVWPDCLAGAGVPFAPVSVSIPCKQGILQGICDFRHRCSFSTHPFSGLKGENRRIPCAIEQGIHFELQAIMKMDQGRQKLLFMRGLATGLARTFYWECPDQGDAYDDEIASLRDYGRIDRTLASPSWIGSLLRFACVNPGHSRSRIAKWQLSAQSGHRSSCYELVPDLHPHARAAEFRTEVR
jgi:hypothetical protein